MPIKITCPKADCARVFYVKENLVGAVVRCPACGLKLRVKSAAPSASQEPPELAPAPHPQDVPRQLLEMTPRVETLGPSPELRWAATVAIILVIISAGGFVGMLALKKMKQTKQTTPSPAQPVQVAETPTPMPAPPVVEKRVLPVKPKPPVFDPLEYARDIAPVNALVDRFQYDQAAEKTKALEAKYSTTPEGRHLITQKMRNMYTLKRLRADTLARINAGHVKFSMKDIAPRFAGEVASVDEQRIVSQTGEAKTETPWSNLDKQEIYIFYAKGGAELDPAGHAALAAYLMEGTYNADHLARSMQVLDVAARRGVNVSDLRRYAELLKLILDALEKAKKMTVSTTPSVATSAPPPPSEEKPEQKPPEFPQPTTTIQTKAPEPNMVLIPAGEFIMGDDSIGDARPQRKVYLDAFLIDIHEVTNAEYFKFCEATNHYRPRYWEGGRVPRGRESHPVVCVNWQDAMAYAQWAGKRLPTEAEWEKAARGTDGRKFPWGNTWDPNRCNSGYSLIPLGFKPGPEGRGWDAIFEAWAATTTGRILMNEGGATKPVGSFPAGASPYGCMDMAGNVAEWCADAYDSEYYKTAPNRNPPGPPGGTYRVSRGGSWACYSRAVQCAYRGMASMSESNHFIGFRCAKDLR